MNNTSEILNSTTSDVVIDLMGLGVVNLHVTPIYNSYGYIEMFNSLVQVQQVVHESIFYKYIDSSDGVLSDLDEEGFIVVYPNSECEIDESGEPYNVNMGEVQRFKTNLIDIDTYLSLNNKEDDAKLKGAFANLLPLLDFNYLAKFDKLQILFQYGYAISTLYPNLKYKLDVSDAHLRHSLPIQEKAPKKNVGSIYIFIDKNKTRFKLGHSINVENRRKALSYASGFDLIVLKVFKKVSVKVERRIHALFRSSSIKGEWYPYDAGLISSMEQEIVRLQETLDVNYVVDK